MRTAPAIFTLFIVVVLAVFFVVGLFGGLPASVQEPFSNLMSGISIGGVEPSLQKFEGRWELALAGGAVECSGGQGKIQVHNGTLRGSIGEVGRMKAISGNFVESGALEGAFSTPNTRGTFSGSVSGTHGEGRWQDDNSCSGELTLKKLEPVVDPTVGKLISFDGRISFVRGGKEIEPAPGMVLYRGDKVEVERGSARLSLGGYPPTVVELSDGKSYTVK